MLVWAAGQTVVAELSSVDALWPWFWPTVAGTLGAVLASFFCVVAERAPRGKSVSGRSVCVCGRQLRWWENIPVIGWVAAGGRARCCGAPIPARYVLCEAGAGVVSAAGVVAFGVSVAALATLAACQVAVLVSCWPRDVR